MVVEVVVTNTNGVPTRLRFSSRIFYLLVLVVWTTTGLVTVEVTVKVDVPTVMMLAAAPIGRNRTVVVKGS